MVVTWGDKEFELNAGDSIYFNPECPHGQRCGGDVPAKFVTIIAQLCVPPFSERRNRPTPRSVDVSDLAAFSLALTCKARSAAKRGNLGHFNASR